MKISRYKSKISMQLVKGTKIVPIPSASVVSIIIDSDFENRAMPIIYATLNVSTDIYNKIIDYRNDGKMYLNIKYYDSNTAIPFYRDRIKGQFIYFPPTNYDYRTALQKNYDPNVDNSYNKLTIGMMSSDLINFNGKTFNGMYRNLTTLELVALVTSGRDFIMDKLDSIEKYDTFFMPPINNRSEAIKYVYEQTYFFNKQYIYFNDFDTSYLTKIDSKKKVVSAKPNTVVFRVNKLNVGDAYYEGMMKERLSYIIYMNSTNLDYGENDITDKIVNNIALISEEGLEDASLNIITNSSVTPKKIYVRESGTGNVENNKSIYESADVIVNIAKPNIDGSIFTPNMIYKIDNSNDDYSKYNGEYSIIYKREVIMKRNNEYTNMVTAGFRKLTKEE